MARVLRASRRTSARLLGAGMLAGVLLLSPAVGATSAWAVTKAEEECEGEKFGYELLALGVAGSLRPETGAEARQHSTVTFSGEGFSAEPEPGRHEELKLRFEIASSEKALAEGTYSDEGVDPAVGAGESEGTKRYTFTSTKAAANLGTVYWEASFTANLKKCNGGEARTFHTAGTLGNKANALQVVREPPPPPPTPEPPPSGSSPGPTTSWSPPGSTLRVAITAARRIRMRGGAFSYLVSCTATCTGSTAVRAWKIHRHHKPVPARALGFRARRVSITHAAGGHVRFNDRFKGRTLRMLRAALRHGGEVKLEVTVAVKDAAGKSTRVSRTILLHG
jgi:hypothetical protein